MPELRADEACDPIGERCTGDMSCCSDYCADRTGEAACAGGSDCRCALGSDCRAAEETCTSDAQCCVGLCDRPGGATRGTCATTGSCAIAGEPCGTEGISGSCCSLACLDSSGTGTPTCQFLGGCLPEEEICTSDGMCCSGACREVSRTSDGRPIMRCANVMSCLAPGEVCGMGASNNCCPDGGGSFGCEPASAGVRRCHGGAPGCTIPSEGCTDVSDCCVDTSSAITCAPNPAGVRVCCLPDGEECSFGSMCCNGVCVPDSGGVLRCGTMCVADGGACTADADCCGCGCVSDGSGGRACTSDPAECSPCTAGGLGDFCTMDSDCCDTDVVRCSTGVEFPTCVLR